MTTKVLLVEGDAAQAAELVEMMAAGAHDDFVVEHAESVAAAGPLLAAGGFDAVLVDFGDPIGRSADLAGLVAAAGAVPVVVLTDRDDQELGAAAMQAGAQDYLVRRDINGEALRRVLRYSRARIRAQAAFEQTLAAHGRELEREVAERTSKLSREIADRIRVEAALRESQHRIQAITDNLFEGVLVVDGAGMWCSPTGQPGCCWAARYATPLPSGMWTRSSPSWRASASGASAMVRSTTSPGPASCTRTTTRCSRRRWAAPWWWPWPVRR